MGTDFWWFFDLMAAAILLITVYIYGRKGFAKIIVTIVGYVLSIFLAATASGSAGDSFYKNGVKSSNIKCIEDALDDNNIAQKTKSYIESLGYNVTLNEANIENIFSKGGDVNDSLYQYVHNINGRVADSKEEFSEKMTEGFAEMMNTILAGALTKYSAEAAADLIRSDMSLFGETLKILQNDGVNKAAVHIEENYTGEASTDIIKIFCFIIIIFLFMMIIKIIAQKVNENDSIRPAGDIADHVIGGVFGAVEGVIVMVIAAAVVRALVILSGNEMMIFNSETIDKTIFFKHIYNIVMKL